MTRESVMLLQKLTCTVDGYESLGLSGHRYMQIPPPTHTPLLQPQPYGAGPYGYPDPNYNPYAQQQQQQQHYYQYGPPPHQGGYQQAPYGQPYYGGYPPQPQYPGEQQVRCGCLLSCIAWRPLVA